MKENKFKGLKTLVEKILLFLWLFFLFLWHTFALEASLDLDKKVSSINDYLNLRLQISSDDLASIKQIKIAWLDNFEKLWQSQSQSSSSQIVIINWKTQQKTMTTVNLDLTLKPLKTWEFEIWPAIIDTWSWEIKTNTIKVKIDWTNIWIWNNNVGAPPVGAQNGNNNIWNNISGQTQRSAPTTKNVVVNPSVHSEINLDDYKQNNKELYILLIILVLFSLWFYYLLKNNKQTLEKTEKQDSQQGGFSPLKTEQEQDFEEKQEIEYPETDEKDFIKKAEKALRKKLEQKFNIKNIDSLTFDEIEKEIQDKLDLKELFAMINKAKYSNIITDYSKILEKIKEI